VRATTTRPFSNLGRDLAIAWVTPAAASSTSTPRRRRRAPGARRDQAAFSGVLAWWIPGVSTNTSWAFGRLRMPMMRLRVVLRFVGDGGERGADD